MLFRSILNLPPINIAFLDSLNTAKTLTTFIDCTLQSRDFSVSQNSIVGERATWLALNVAQELPDKYLKVPTYSNQAAPI